MPLPPAGTKWPPTDTVVQCALADWDAWYSAEPDRLVERYSNRGIRELPEDRPSQYRGGVWGRLARWWWGTPTPVGAKRAKIHIPLAGDIARTSSDLLFSEPPSLTVDHTGTQDALAEFVEDGLHVALMEGGEVCGALGGVGLRVVWDEEVSDRPWISAVHADAIVPEFRYGRLRAMTIWTVVETDGRTIWRHLERHERGVILHGLYKGNASDLGKVMALDAHEATRGLKPVVETGAPEHLTAVYVPNVRPARAWRHIPSAAHLGQSDFQGIEGIMDALDEAYTSWMRDIRLGKGRITVPNAYLESNGPGQGGSWNEDQEVYAGLDMLPRPGDPAALTVSQFAIRVAEHRDTCQALVEQAVRQAGYSAATFGADADGSAVTATEIRARQRRSMTTRARKALYWGPGLADITEAWLAVCAGDLFRVPDIEVERPEVEFQDSISESAQERAETSDALRRAEAASTETLVRMNHPDWDDTAVAEEVDRIHAESGRAVSDPERAGRDTPLPPGAGPDEGDGQEDGDGPPAGEEPEPEE
jgi:A118 family predicted phage portal protein